MAHKKRISVKVAIRGREAEAVDALLDAYFWHPSIKVGESYHRRSDDTDGDDLGVSVDFGPDGDAWVQIKSFCKDGETGENLYDRGSHRFRTGFGGGSSLRVRMAFMILARAIQMDQADLPDR